MLNAVQPADSILHTVFILQMIPFRVDMTGFLPRVLLPPLKYEKFSNLLPKKTRWKESFGSDQSSTRFDEGPLLAGNWHRR